MQELKKIEPHEIEEIINEHLKWRCSRSLTRTTGKQAVFSYRLFEGPFRNIDLGSVIFHNCEFVKANFFEVNLTEATFINCTFRNASLIRTCFDDAYFKEVYFQFISLRNCSFKRAFFCCNSFERCLYHGTHFIDCVFMTEPFIVPSSDRHIVLSEVPSICPTQGEFIGWKKCRDNIIVKLLIPDSAKRSSAIGRKCRCSEAVVLELYGLNDDDSYSRLPDDTIALSCFDPDFKYEVGKSVKVEDFDDNRWNRCSTGIHFFIDPDEAIRYGG